MKSKPEFKDIQKLLNELILPFYEIDRDLYLPIQNHRRENDAEHSWSLALLAMALAPEVDESLDVGKVAMFAVVHDLVEVYAGDTSVWAAKEEHATKAQREKAAAATINKRFTRFASIGKTIDEYESKKSPEAKFVWALDKFLALLMLYEDGGYYYHHHKITYEQFEKQFVTHRKKAHADPVVKEYYEQLRKKFSDPKYFHKKS